MEFKEYLEFCQLQEDVNFINEGLGSTMAGILDAGVSGLGTTGKQLIRGAGNVGGGAIRAGANALGTVFGSPESRKKSKENLGSSIKQIGRGLMQAAGSGLSGLYRGYEQGTNPFSSMKQDSGSGWGEMMGVRKKQAQSKQNQQAQSQQNQPSWEDLYSKWMNSKDANEKASLLSQMKKFHREKYEQLKISIQKEKIKTAAKIFGFQKGEELTQESLNEKYRQLVKTHHPDKGGDPVNFKKIQAAYEMLRDRLTKKAV